MRPIIVVGLGFGDEGKGSIVDFLVRKYGAPIVCRFSGGAQCAHNVVLPDGRHHTFAQFGSGTLVPKTKTILSKYVLVDPFALESEEKALRRIGILDGYQRMFIDEQAIVATPFHKAVNRLRELARGAGRHGTCGMGIGETMADSLARPDVLRIGDLFTDNLLSKLKATKEAMQAQLESLNLDVNALDAWFTFTFNVFNHPLEQMADHYKHVAAKINPVRSQDVSRMLRNENVIFEGSQGILLDQDYGFHPYTTWTSTTKQNAILLLEEAGFDAEYPVCMGVTRVYSTRHGAGPFPTENAQLTKDLPDKHNGDIGLQGQFRVGWLDLEALHYATQANKGIDVVALTHMDKLTIRPEWQINLHYEEYIPSLPSTLKEQEELTRQISTANCHLMTWTDTNIIPAMVEAAVGAKIGMLSAGPTHREKFEAGTPIKTILGRTAHV